MLPLHGELSNQEQDQAVAPGPGRKIVVATNVAETSITIDGIELIIDSGLARVARYDPHRGIDTLRIEKIGQASAEQRSGGPDAPRRADPFAYGRGTNIRIAPAGSFLKSSGLISLKSY